MNTSLRFFVIALLLVISGLSAIGHKSVKEDVIIEREGIQIDTSLVYPGGWCHGGGMALAAAQIADWILSAPARKQ
jgi:hypothetical protein